MIDNRCKSEYSPRILVLEQEDYYEDVREEMFKKQQNYWVEEFDS